MKKNNEKPNAGQPVTFVHSLFRSGSTYIYNALKRTGNFHVYHEPMHEVIASLPNAWDELVGRKDQLKTSLRHDFLVGGYFDEFSHLLPSIKKTFNTKLSFDFYFMDAGDQAPELKAYIDLLVDGAPKVPVLQCTRTVGRIGWLKENYQSKHVFLLRNPWDQWYSYKVDPYIATTPRVIYSQSNIPAVLEDVLKASGASPLMGDDTQAKVVYGFNHLLPPTEDYFLFFGLWLHAFISGKQGCDVFIDMDALSSSEAYREQSLAKLVDIGLKSIDLSDVNLHRAVFSSREQATYSIAEEQVLEIYRQHGIDVEILNTVREYLKKGRKETFVSERKQNEPTSGILEDASRMRETLLARDRQSAKLTSSLNQAMSERDGQISSLNQAVTERDGQLNSLNQAMSERDGQISSLNQAVTERDGQISSLTDETVRRGEWALRLDSELMSERAKLNVITSSNSWLLTKPVRETRRWLTAPNQQAKRYLKGGLRLAKRIYQSLPLSYKTKTAHRNALAKYFPKLLLVSGSHLATIPILALPAITQAIPEKFPNHADFARTIDIPTSENPLVSVIIPIYGQIDYTLRCLASIVANVPHAAFEVIVVDDFSPDISVEILTSVKGIRLIRNAQNQGFIRSCNAGSRAAKGDYLYFLNNDTVVTPGWLDELLRTFHDFPGTGLVGSKLVYPDGRLQEAGGIIWQDASAWNFGKFQDSLLPVYNYAREVDYCSGASIMVPKSLFDELGGFDEHYLPAYCEDSDLALKTRDKGYRVIYQPMSTVIHYEGITSGTDTSQGTKAYQIENSKKLFDRWKERLQTHQLAGTDADSAKDRRATRCVLVIDHCTPTPNQDAGSVTAYNLMLLLREMDFQVTFIPEDNFLYMPEYTTALQRVGIEVLYAPYVTNVEQHLKECGDRYDLAFLFRPGVVERHLKTIRKHCTKAKVLFHTVDLHFLRMSREAELQSDKTKQIAADEMKQRELAAIRASDASIVHSTAEFDLLRPELPDAKLHVYPLIMDVQGTSKTFAERRDIVFVGGYQHAPNVDAVQYFVAEIMPLLRQQLPGVRFYAVGSKPPAEIEALASEDVIITGFVEDLTPLLDKMRVSVAPLRYGAGIKGKIGTAMAVGLPVVATTLAAEGMSLTEGENVLVADGAEAFAESITKIYQNEALWKRINKNGLTFADKAWGAEAAWGILAGILRELNFNPVRDSKQLSLYANNNYCISSGEDKKKPQASIVLIDEAYQRKIQQELAIYEKQVKVHDLPDIYHYWSNKYLAPIFHEAGFGTIAEFFSSNLLAAASRTGSAIANFVSVGAGNCDLEVAVARNLVNAGFNNFALECLEINPVMLERGKKIAEENGVLGNMHFVEADFNTWVASKRYDAVMANQSLHHVTRLEHLFDQIKNGLHDEASFVISDMIGRNGHQRWPESLEIVNTFWKELPESHKFNVLLNRLEKEYDNWDCSKEGFEGIRAQDVLPLLLQRFPCEKFVGFGSAIDIFVDRCFGHNFNRELEWDRSIIDRVHEEDETGLLSGRLTPTHMMAVFVKTLHCTPYFSRGIDPDGSVRKP